MTRILRLLLLTGALLALGAVPALGDASDPVPSATHGTLVTNPDGSRTLTVSGGTDATSDPGWKWTTHHSNCNTDRAGVGVAIDWNDPNDAGNPITGTVNGKSVTIGLGTATDNVVHPTPGPVFHDIASPSDYLSWRGGCGVFQAGLGYNTGVWGPISHTYAASVKGAVTICPIMYDVHGKTSGTAPNGIKEVTAGGNNHNGDNSLQSNGNTPLGNGCFSASFATPHLTLLKEVSADGGATWSKSVTVAAGATVIYRFTVTNDGETGTNLTSVHINELTALADCDSSLHAISPAGFAGNLAVGATAVFVCNHTMGSDPVTNTANAGGDSPSGPVKSNDDQAVVNITGTPPEPGGQAVLGERITPGTANLAGPSGCTARAFNARVRGTKMVSVTFVLDGKVIKKVSKVGSKRLVQARINPANLKVGVHRLLVRITFQPGSRTQAKTLRLSFQRCGKKLSAPRFTG